MANRHHTQKSEGACAERQASVLLAKDPQELEQAYDQWAHLYDEDLVKISGTGVNEAGLAASRVLMRQFGEVIAKDKYKILDFGCGTFSFITLY
jgi:16S rRNA G1207 methylase RsmC